MTARAPAWSRAAAQDVFTEGEAEAIGEEPAEEGGLVVAAAPAALPGHGDRRDEIEVGGERRAGDGRPRRIDDAR